MPLYPSGSTYPGSSIYPGSISAGLSPGEGLFPADDLYPSDAETATPSPTRYFRPRRDTWIPRLRRVDLTLDRPLVFSEAILVERYNQPDTLALTGHIDRLRPALEEGVGIFLVDDLGHVRFSGWADDIERRGDKTATVTFVGDLALLWDRICWPQPDSAWTLQNVDAYDVQTAPQETRMLSYILRNAGTLAYNGDVDRRISGLRMPGDSARGTTATTSARFDNLGQLCADLAEAASLRIRMIQTVEYPSNYLDVIIEDAPDLSSWASFGDGYGGGPGLLAEGWRYRIASGYSTILSAAGGEGTARILNLLHDAARVESWKRYREFFVDQRDNEGDATEIAEGMSTAMIEQAPTSEVEAPIIGGNLRFGSAPGEIAVGTKVAVILDGEIVIERIRQITTTISLTDGAESVRVEPTVGTPDAGVTVDQLKLVEALRRLRTLESR